MPPWTDGDAPPNPEEDARITELISALSALQEPARVLRTSISTVLNQHPSRLSESLLRNLANIAESCELLGPSTARALRELVSILGDDG